MAQERLRGQLAAGGEPAQLRWFVASAMLIGLLTMLAVIVSENTMGAL